MDCVLRWKKEFDFNADGQLNYVEFYSALSLVTPTSESNKSENLQIVLLGAMECELRCHVLSFINNVYTQPVVVNTDFIDYPVQLESGVKCVITPTVGPMWTENGKLKDEHDRTRIMDFVGVDIILITFSVISPRTFQIVEKIFLPEILQYTSNIPFFLVGVHTELRKNPEILKKLKSEDSEPISRQQGEALAVQIGALKYFDVSAQKMEGLRDCFLESVGISLSQVKE